MLIMLSAQCQIPNVISYQGILLNQPAGDPVANGPHTVKFRFYDAPSAGNFQWETSQIEVNTFKGLFSTLIPVPSSATWAQPLYVEVISNGQEMGRIPLTTVPYAFRAATALAMDASGLSGTISDARLTAHLQDLADGTLTGAKVGEGILANNITTGTLPASVLPANTITGTGTAGQVAYWIDAQQVGADGLVWDAADNELGIGIAAPFASLGIIHAAAHPIGTALAVENTWNQSGIKTGIDVSLTANSSGMTYGISTKINASGTGARYGVSSTASSEAANPNLIVGVAGYADGQGTGEHRGVVGQATGGGSGQQTGILGEATGTGSGIKYGVQGIASGAGASKYGIRGEVSGGGLGSVQYGVYGTASGLGATNFGVYSNGNLHTVGNITYTGDLTKTSDRKLKRNITPLTGTLANILKLRPSTYFFRTTEYPDMNLSTGKQVGLIAQEVEKVFPELVSVAVNAAHHDDNGNELSADVRYKSVDYVSLIPILIKGIQEQQAMIDELKKEVQRLTADHVEHNSKAPVAKPSAK